MREHLHVDPRGKSIFIRNQVYELPTQPSSIVLQIANVWTIILMKHDYDNTEQEEICINYSEDFGDSTLLSNIEEDDLVNMQDVIYPDHTHHNMASRTLKYPLPKTQSSANTVIALTLLPDLQHPAWAEALP